MMIICINKKLIRIIVTFAGLLFIFIGCASIFSSTREEIPETDDLFSQLNGYVIIDRPASISAIELPLKEQFIVREPYKTSKAIHRISGPDKQGRIAFIDDDLEFYSLKLIEMRTKNETEILSRKGSHWSHEKENYGISFSYSDTGGFVAFVRNYDGVSKLIPNVYVSIGHLEIIDTDKKSDVKTSIKVLDQGLDWFPDGSKLVYTALIPRFQISKDIETQFADGFGSDMISWPNTPIVTMLNLKDMSTKQLHIGWNPRVSKDGSSIAIQDYQGRIRLYKVSNGSSLPVSVPIGQECHVFSMIGKDYLLYKTIPIKGRKHRMTSTFGRTPIWTLRVAQMNTTRYKTVVQDLDRHRRVSYGVVEQKRN